MVERLLILKNNELNEEIENDDEKASSQLLDEDDGDSASVNTSQGVVDDATETSNNVISTKRTDEVKRNLLLVKDSTFDSSFDRDVSVPDEQVVEKRKKKKRRTQESLDMTGTKRVVSRKKAWYKKIDLKKPIMYVTIVVLLYLMWTKRDIWIPRLFKSNPRARHLVSNTDNDHHEINESSETFNSSDVELEVSMKPDSNQNIGDDDRTTVSNTSESTSTTSNKNNDSPKLRLRSRRNKMKFSKDGYTKILRNPRYRLEDDDDDDNILIDDADVITENMVVRDSDEKDNNIKSSKVKEAKSRSQKHSIKNQRHRHANPSSEKILKRNVKQKSNVILPVNDNIIEQLRTLFKSKDQRKKLSKALSKKAGVTTKTVKKFLGKRDYSAITLHNLLSILRVFNSTVLIVPK